MNSNQETKYLYKQEHRIYALNILKNRSESNVFARFSRFKRFHGSSFVQRSTVATVNAERWKLFTEAFGDASMPGVVSWFMIHLRDVNIPA